MHRKNQQFHHAHARRSLISRGNAGSSTSHHQVDFVRPRSQYEGKGDDEDVEEIINDSDDEERAHLHFLETGKPLGCASPPPKHDSNPFTQLEKERDRFSLPPPEHTEYDPYDGTAVSNRYTSTSSKRIAPASFYNKLDLKRPRFEYDPYNLATTPPRRYGQQYGARDDSDLTEPGSSPEPDRHSSARDGHSPHREYDHTSSTQHGWSDDEYYDSEDEYLKKAKEEEQKRRDRKYGFPGTDDEIESGGSDELVSGDEWDELFFDGPIPTTEQMERFKGRPLTDEEREKQDQLQKAKAEYEAQKDEEERAKEEEAYDEANGILPYQRRLYRVWKPIVKDNGFEDLVNVTPHVWAPFPTKQIGPWCMLKSQRDKLPRFLFLNFENKPYVASGSCSRSTHLMTKIEMTSGKSRTLTRTTFARRQGSGGLR